MINRRTLIILVMSISFALSAATGLWWVVVQIDELGTDLNQQVEVIADALAQEQQYSELTDLIKASEPMRDSLDSLILTEERTIDFLARIEKVGVEQGVDLDTSSLEVKSTEGTFDILVVNFKIVGSKDRVANMMKILETLPYHSELRTSRLTNNPDTGLSTMTVTLEVSLLPS